MEKFALIGKTLKHSYSKIIHGLMADYAYDLIELEENALEDFVKNCDYKGYNVTIPYKKAVMKYLDQIDKSALEIGAVNTVVNQNGLKVGYNTDFFGMEYAMKKAKVDLKDKVVMILGSGGTCLTATAVAKKACAKEILFVSRSGEINYQNCYDRKDVQVIINTTPVGMFPNNYSCPIDLSRFENLTGVFDAIYNPNLTRLIYDARKRNISASNGLPMLVGQAKKAMDLFTGQEKDDKIIEKVTDEVYKQTANVVLIGMAGCGKSTLAKLISQKTGRELIDTDLEIVKKDGRDIPTIFRESGEEYFRQLEREVLSLVGEQSGKIIATGGGVVENEQNYFSLKQNGQIFHLVRDVDKLDRSGRPLSSSQTAVNALYERRKPLYQTFSDYTIDNNGDVNLAVNAVMERL